MRRNVVVSICAVLTLAAAACKRSATYSTKDGSVTIEQKGSGDTGSMTFTSKDGKGTVNINSGGKVPDDYPKDLPVYPDAKVTLTQAASEKHSFTLLLESGDTVEKISDFYKKGLESNGWKTDNTVTTDEMTMLTATKQDRQAVIQVLNSGEKRTINQVLTDKQ